MKFSSIFIIIIVAILSCLTSCSNTPNELKIAEQLMKVHPDSALHILQKLHPQKYNSDANRALYGLLLFQALDKNDMTLQPDSLINFSISYYLKREDKPHLAMAYFYKARKLNGETKYEEAAIEFYKSIDNCKINSDYLLLGKIYQNLATINFIQKENNEARRKYRMAASLFTKAGEIKNISNVYLNIGYIYVVEKKYKIARLYYQKVYSLKPDSLTYGATLTEIGTSYYHNKQYDSALYYYRKSLSYPVKEINKSIRYFTVADVLFNKMQYDSSTAYAFKSLKYPANHYTRRECYRILVNISYLKGDIYNMNQYMTKYQSYVDSIHVMESQTKATVIEDIHDNKVENIALKQNLTISTFILIGSILFIIIIGLYFYYHTQIRKQEIKDYKQKIKNKQEFVNQNISDKIEGLKSIQANSIRNTLYSDRIKLDKELYYNALHLEDWEKFSHDMNQTFNNIIEKLQAEYPALSRKEINWCCLHLLNIANTDRVLLLETTTGGLYKLKHRITQKLNLNSTKELDSFLKKKAANRI